VFPEAYNLLCRFHIDKNVKAKCKMLVHPREAWDQVMEVWGFIVGCDIVEAFEDRVNALRVVCSPWLIFVDYVMDTWLHPHKEKFVKAWIDKVMHLGNTTSNKVEATHWSLKRVLQKLMGDLCFCWDSINKMIILQYNAIKASFQKSLHVVGHRFKVTAYKKLLGFVFKYVLNLIFLPCETTFSSPRSYNNQHISSIIRNTYQIQKLIFHYLPNHPTTIWLHDVHN